MEPRKDWSGMYSRVCIPGSFYSLQPAAGGKTGDRRNVSAFFDLSTNAESRKTRKRTVCPRFSRRFSRFSRGAAGSPFAGHRGSLQSLLKLSPCVPQLGSTIEDE